MSFANPDALVRNLTTYFLRRNEMGRLANSNCPIINGDFNFWQRGVTFAAIASATYSADRWRYDKVGAMVHTVSRDADVPTVAQSGHKSNYSIKIDCTTIDAAIAAGDFVILSQRIEGYNFQPLEAKTFYLSFWVKATKTGIYCVAFRNSGNDRSYVVEYTVNNASTWERKVITIPFNFAGGTWDYTNGVGLNVSWSLAAGATFQTTADAWQNGNFLATANQVNACDNTANDFYLSQVQLRPDNPSYYVVDRLFDEELAACQRYYEKSYNLGTYAGAATPTGASEWTSAGGASTIGDYVIGRPNFVVSKRSSPTVTAYDSAGTAGRVYLRSANSGRTDNIVPSVGQITIHNFIAAAQTTATTQRGIGLHWEADAEL